MPYSPSHIWTADQVDVLEDHPDSELRAPHEIANILGRSGHPLFGGADPSAIPSLDAGEPARLTPASAQLTTAATVVVESEPEAMLPASPIAEGDGTELLGVDDLVIPRLRIKNPMTDADGVPEGEFFLSTDLDDHKAELRLAVLHVTPKRELKVPMDDGKRRDLITRVETHLGRTLDVPEKAWALCRSDDRKLPAAGQLLGLTSCEGCWFSKWKREDGANVCECRDNYELVVVDLDTLQPIVWTLRGSAMKPAKKLNTMLVMKLRRQKGKGKAWAYATKVTLDKIKGKVGHYYAPNFGKLEAIEDDDLIAELGELRADMIGARIAPEVRDASEEIA